MEEVRQLVQEEGREARNLVAFHVVMDSPSRISRKPPRAGPVTPRRAPPRPPAAPRLRSASAGRDKRSELRARYWALLFGDLQRAIGEIYNTVEAHENLSECQEVILVLENYTRDFKALCEWFRLKWEYDNTPPPQRPQSLAWEVRKTDFVRPESRRAHSVKSSPSVSGKNSPSLSGYNTPSGKNSPNLTGKISPGSGKVSPRVCSGITSPKGNVEFFSNKIATKFPAKPEAKAAKESRLSDIKEKVSVDLPENEDLKTEDAKDVVVEIGEAKECPNVSPKPVVIKTKKPKANVQKKKEELSSHAKSTIAALNVMECSFLEKQLLENAAKNDNNNMINKDKPEEVKSPEINEKVDDKAKVVENGSSMESPNNSEDNFADVSNESSPVDDKINSSNDDKAVIDTNGAVDGKIKSQDVETAVAAENGEIDEPNEAANLTPKTTDDVTTNQNKEEPQRIDTKATEVNGDATAPKEEGKKDQEVKTESKIEVKPSRPAYSQAAAKPKLVTPKVETKPPMKTTPIVRSKTVVEMRPVSAAKTQNKYPKKNQQTNKCSYPFNLTTGRTLFDFAPPPPNNKPGAKKPVPIKNMQMATGDLKNKPDAKKLPPRRPSTLKVNEKGDKCDKANPQLEKIKDYDEYGSSDTVVAQIDMNRIESSDSLKTLVPEELLAHDVANSIEVLNFDGNKNDNDGWLTVKSRRLSRESKKQSKSHWSNRFHQPSATTSLPTLNMIESPRQESKSIIENSKFDRAKSEQPQTGIPVPKEKSVKVNAAQKPKSDRSKDTSMIRQKSDVTGLKTRSARNKSFKKTEKAKEPKSPEHTGSELTKNRLHSSLESLSGLSRSQESTEDPFDFDKWKAEFKSYFKYLEEDDQMPNQNEILQSADPSEMSELAEMTSQIEENERKMALALDFQSEVDQRKLCEEEDLLNRQIMELQQVSDVDLDTETDDTETDAELHCGDRPPPPMIQMSQNNLGSLAASLEDQYESALAGMSWAERVDTLVVLEELVARDPGRAQQLHAKLSTGIKRRGSFQDALRRLQAKQARAEQQRLDLQTERSKRIHCLLTRVEEVKVAKNQLIEEKRLRMERRLQKAEENRNQHLKHIVRKAHDEEEKLREIAFIKQLEAENRRHDFLDQCRSHTTRLRQLRREHMLKLEQKAAREAAVGARRQAIEEARRLHVETLLEKRKERDARVEELKEQKKQERDDAAREKAEGVKSRLSALAAAAELEADALRSRIRDKQESTQQRLATHLQAIRSKATAPRQATTSESQELNEEEETDRLNQEKREKERQKAIKKRARKLRQKLLAIGNIFEQLSGQEIGPPLLTNTKIWKLMTQINNILTSIAPVDNKSCKKKDINQNGIDSNSDILAKSDANLNDSKELNGIDNHVTTEKKKKKKKASSEEKQVVPSDEVKSNVKDEEPEEKVTNINKNCINYIKKCEIKTLNDSKNQKLKEMGPELFAAMLNDQKPKESSPDTNTVTNNNEPNYQNLKESSPDRNTVTNVNETNDQKQKESSSDTNIATNGTNNQILKESSPDTNAATNINGTNNQNLKELTPDTNAASNKKSKSKKKADKIKEQEATKVDKPAKLSKTSSVASSMSDMSKVSSSKKDLEKRPIVNVDWMHLEKILNELNRIMEKVDKHSQEVLVHGLRIFSQIINMAVDKEENGAQVTTRSLTACVQMISRVVGGCPIAAAYFMNTNGCVHLAKLLSQLLEKDLEADKNEMALAAATADSLSISLDSVLVTTRLHEEWKEDPSKTPRDDVPMLQSLRQRAHGTVSYICLSGCITRAEDAGSIRESVIAMATVCADLCHPCDVDTGQDRANALHSLRASLAGSLCGSRSEFCQLFDRGAALQYNGTHAEFVKAARTAHLLKAAAQLDHTIVQDAFGEGRWPLEFRAAVARLLSQHAPNDREAPRQKSNWVVNCRLDHKLSETMVLDLITLLGFVVVNNPQHQETICDGWSAVKTLCTLPANWIVSRPHCHALLPTLAALAQHPPAAAVIASELSLKMIEEYLASPEAQRVKLVQVILEGRKKQGNSAKK